MSHSLQVNKNICLLHPPAFLSERKTKLAAALPLPPKKRMRHRGASARGHRPPPSPSSSGQRHQEKKTRSGTNPPINTGTSSALPSGLSASCLDTSSSASGGEEPSTAAVATGESDHGSVTVSDITRPLPKGFGQTATCQSINAALSTATPAATVQKLPQPQQPMPASHRVQQEQEQQLPPPQSQQTRVVRRRRVDLQVPPTSASPYAGCRFTLQHACAEQASAGAPVAERWMWGSQVYHPVLSKGQALCNCVVSKAHAMNPSNPASATLVLLADMLERPLQTKYCSSCPVRKDVLAEALLDYAFFSRKARLYTAGAKPITAVDLRRGAHEAQTVNLIGLLETGAYSDITIVVDGPPQVTFKCHKSVLASKSQSFKSLFEANSQKVELRLQRTGAATFARYLYYCYSGELPRHCKLAAEEYLTLGAVAHACKTEHLRQFCVTMLQSTVTAQNVCDLLLKSQTHREPSQSALLLRFLGVHLRAASKTKGWDRMLQGMQGKAGIIVRKLSVIARNGQKKTALSHLGESSAYLVSKARSRLSASSGSISAIGVQGGPSVARKADKVQAGEARPSSMPMLAMTSSSSSSSSSTPAATSADAALKEINSRHAATGSAGALGNNSNSSGASSQCASAAGGESASIASTTIASSLRMGWSP